jgi:hypothetical protein
MRSASSSHCRQPPELEGSNAGNRERAKSPPSRCRASEGTLHSASIGRAMQGGEEGVIRQAAPVLVELRCTIGRSAICSPYPQARRAAPASTPDRVLGRMWGASLHSCIDLPRPSIQLHHRIGRPCRPKGVSTFRQCSYGRDGLLSSQRQCPFCKTRHVPSASRSACPQAAEPFARLGDHPRERHSTRGMIEPPPSGSADRKGRRV